MLSLAKLQDMMVDLIKFKVDLVLRTRLKLLKVNCFFVDDFEFVFSIKLKN